MLGLKLIHVSELELWWVFLRAELQMFVGFLCSYARAPGKLYDMGVNVNMCLYIYSWWRHQMDAFSALLAPCARNSPVTGEFPAQRPVTRSFDVFCDLRLNKRLNKQSWGRWFETPSCQLWHHCNVLSIMVWQKSVCIYDLPILVLAFQSLHMYVVLPIMVII